MPIVCITYQCSQCGAEQFARVVRPAVPTTDSSVAPKVHDGCGGVWQKVVAADEKTKDGTDGSALA